MTRHPRHAGTGHRVKRIQGLWLAGVHPAKWFSASGPRNVLTRSGRLRSARRLAILATSHSTEFRRAYSHKREGAQ